MLSVRPSAVAGTFYPAQGPVLAQTVQSLLQAARDPLPDQAPKALIVPHAGYVYSGATAALAYRQLAKASFKIKRVVLLGPTHRVAVRGLALPAADAFATPLGAIAIDAQARAQLAHLPQVVVSDPAHAQEHSLEVQLPFLQTLLGPFKLVPLAVGQASPQQVAEVLDALWGGDETLIVISTDLSHFLNYPAAQAIDGRTVQAILGFEASVTHEQACGATPVNGMLLAAQRHGLQIRLLGHCNSGDTAGDKQRVVGYAAFALEAGSQAMTADKPAATVAVPASEEARGTALLALARAAIARALGLAGGSAVAGAAWQQQAGATFVTLTQQGRLRGCIGSLQAHRALRADVEANAVAAALRDPRFTPLKAAELPYTRVEVSLLSAPEPMTFSDEADALRQLRPGVDGIILSYGAHRSTFLPQVWEQLPAPVEFMAHLKQKAGLGADFWDPALQLQRYTVTKWKEGE